MAESLDDDHAVRGSIDEAGGQALEDADVFDLAGGTLTQDFHHVSHAAGHGHAVDDDGGLVAESQAAPAADAQPYGRIASVGERRESRDSWNLQRQEIR